jgi:hypothetical protein
MHLCRVIVGRPALISEGTRDDPDIEHPDLVEVDTDSENEVQQAACKFAKFAK